MGIFIPFHLEYCGLYKSKINGDRGIVFRGVDTFLLVDRKTTNVNDYLKYIKLLTDKVTNGDNGETEEERISREFNVNCLVKIAEGIGKRIDRDRKYITKEDISPILDGLQSTINYLKYIEPKD